MIIYGHTKGQVEKQLKCDHKNWHGPCMDKLSRYYKCLDCFCLDRDFNTEKQYLEAKEELDNELV